MASVCFALAILHTFSVKRFQHLALQFKEGSVGENLFHLLGEVEVVFGLWGAIFILFVIGTDGVAASVQYLEGRNFTEPAFVFVIMAVCSTRPVLKFANGLIEGVSRLIPLPRAMAFYLAALILGPLLGSFITEPAAMTVTALILLDRYFSRNISEKFKYATLGLLFVNVSIGGTLTPYAAPPVLMVAPKWGWDFVFMFGNFGWKALLAVSVSTVITVLAFRRELVHLSSDAHKKSDKAHAIPLWVIGVHLLALAGVVLSSHHMVMFMGVFLFFLGLVNVTREYQNTLKLREGLLVGFFLAGLVVLGGPQRWWLEPLLTRLDALPLYLGAMSLTAITDNAALTYLGSQVPSLSESAKYALVAGSVVGGGLTIIANAPNPAGYGILNPAFGKEGISPLYLFLYALMPTVVAGLAFWIL